MKNIAIFLLSALCVFATGCKKLTEVDSPPTKFDATKAYSTDGNAIAVMTKVYQEMSNDGFAQGINSISFFTGLSADELIDYNFSEQRTAAYQNKLSKYNVPFWSRLYYLVYTTNTALEGINKSTTLTPLVKQRLLGEVRFMRAFLYFYLVNFWGDVPLLLTNDYQKSLTASRTPKAKVYEQIKADLIEAESLLSDDYLGSDLKSVTTERIRPNRITAKALLARVCLYTQDYQNAEKLASEIIENTATYDFTPLNEVFLLNSKEAIWQIQPISMVWNTFDARGFILKSAPNNFQPVSLSKDFIASFEVGDNRRKIWVDSLTEGTDVYYFPVKYTSVEENLPLTEYLMVFRLSEQYIIRAEARAAQNNVNGAIEDINRIRSRARMTPTDEMPNPLPPIITPTDVETLMEVIAHERRVELFTEWGHRWFDLKRTETIDKVMNKYSPEKGSTWDINSALWPIPDGEIQMNKNMIQNLGY